jgi:GTP-dependent phosphoenolpyruvate carboxykinase
MGITPDAFREATAVRVDEWKKEIEMQGEFFQTIGAKMPRALELQRELLASALDYGAPMGEA